MVNTIIGSINVAKPTRPASFTELAFARLNKAWKSSAVDDKRNELQEKSLWRVGIYLPLNWCKSRGTGISLDKSLVQDYFCSLLWEDAGHRPRVQVRLPLTKEQHLLQLSFTLKEICPEICPWCSHSRRRQVRVLVYVSTKTGNSSNHLSETIQRASSIESSMKARCQMQSWHKARLPLLFKGGPKENREDLNRYQEIASEESQKKIFNKVRIWRLEGFLDRTLPHEHFRFPDLES